ncbi:MAG TPA: hypothetical protein VHM65_01560 [Candidatus Lustribacter sp.]|nr:hypothetical protein [Candidatus Lustribacter sp.]
MTASTTASTTAPPGGSVTTAAAPGPPASSTRAGALLDLPRGGRTIFPAYRLVGFSGAPGSAALGRLGIGAIDDRVSEIERLGASYAKGRTVLPVLELIATVAHRSPGRDDMFRSRASDATISRYLAAARRHRGILLLNISPGRARFLDEVTAYARWLAEPDVGLALDPEWAVGPGQVPGRVFGHTSGAELDSIARYVAGLVAAKRLPEKVVLYHQLHVSIVAGESALTPHPGVVLVKSVDGIGTPAQKASTWRSILRRTPTYVHPGFKLFFIEDREHGPLMTPAQVLALRPTPEYVLYE